MQAAAVALDSIDGASVTGDGGAMLLITTTSTNAELVVSVPADQLSTLLATTIAARTESRQRTAQTQNPLDELIIVQQWALGRDADKTPILTLTLTNGGRLSFKLDDAMLSLMGETVAIMIYADGSDGQTNLTRPN